MPFLFFPSCLLLPIFHGSNHGVHGRLHVGQCRRRSGTVPSGGQRYFTLCTYGVVILAGNSAVHVCVWTVVGSHGGRGALGWALLPDHETSLSKQQRQAVRELCMHVCVCVFTCIFLSSCMLLFCLRIYHRIEIAISVVGSYSSYSPRFSPVHCLCDHFFSTSFVSPLRPPILIMVSAYWPENKIVHACLANV